MNAVIIATILSLSSVLVPSKGWYAPNEPILVTLDAKSDLTLMLSDFAGKSFEAQGGPQSAVVKAGQQVDVKRIFPILTTPGTYILYALPADARSITQFSGTPLVIGVRDDRRRGAPPGAMVVKVEPLVYADITTDKGAPMRVAFFYDVAPNTAANFIDLARTHYYDGLTFHRIVPGFVIQGGDPRGDGSGGPGYMIDAEFNDRPHEEGVLSMARSGDPNEASGAPPRSEFANSAGSQFFVCLDYNATKQLDRRYTGFGRVIDGMETVKAIAAAPVADPRSGRPETPPVITKVEIKPVTAEANPYSMLQALAKPKDSLIPAIPAGIQPATQPAVAP